MKTCFLIAALASAAYAQLLPPGLSSATTPNAPAVPSTAISPDTVVAKVAGISVTVADVRKMLESAPDDLRRIFQSNPQQALEVFYQFRYMAAEAEKEGLDKKPPYKEQLDELIELLKQQVLANAYVNELHDGYNVTGEEIDNYYAKNQSRWEEAKIRVILINFKPGKVGDAKAEQNTEDKLKQLATESVLGAHTAADRTEEEAQKLASDLVRQLRGGADFAAFVAKYSDDAESKASGGDFGTPIKANSSFAPDLKKAVLALNKGEISDPIRQGNGFYIIRLEEKSVQPINDVRQEIVMTLRDNNRDKNLHDLQDRFKPEVTKPEFFIQPQRYLSEPPPTPPAK